MNSKLMAAIFGMLAFGAAQGALSAEMPTLRYVEAGNSTSLSQLPITVARTK